MSPSRRTLRDMRGFVFDLDGCVWTGDVLTPGAAQVLALIRQQGKAVCFLTNNSRARARTMQAKLVRLAMNLDPGIGVGLVFADFVADLQMENLRTAARQTAKPGVFELGEDLGTQANLRGPPVEQIETSLGRACGLGSPLKEHHAVKDRSRRHSGLFCFACSCCAMNG